MNEVTQILSAIEQGDPSAAQHLLPLVYDELRKLAATRLAREKPGQTLEATALVHEAYLRLVTPTQSSLSQEGDQERVHWNSRAHFFAAAAEAMRRILVDFARARRNDKRGGRAAKVPLDEALAVSKDAGQDLVALDEALQALAVVHPRKSDVVELRFFGGLSLEETAEVLRVSVDTVKRDWRFAKLWLLKELRTKN